MADLWLTLLPLIVGAAVVPIQIVITLLLLRAARGIATALCFVAGMVLVRLVQGVVFGLLFPDTSTGDGSAGPGPAVSGILLALAMLLYATAVKTWLSHDDPDAPPPRWMSVARSARPSRAFLLGAGLVLIGPKFWVFTLSAVGAVRGAGLGVASGTLSFIAYDAACSTLLLAPILARVIAPSGSTHVLDASGAWLERHNRPLVIVLGVVFGSWFLVKGLAGLDVI